MPKIGLEAARWNEEVRFRAAVVHNIQYFASKLDVGTLPPAVTDEILLALRMYVK